MSGRRGRVLAAVAAVLALVCALATGWSAYARLAPHRPDAVLHPGQDAVLDGVRYRLDAFTVATTLPAAERGDPPVAGPPGSVLVLVVVSETVLDRTRDVDALTCDVTLLAEPGGPSATSWETDSEVTGSAARPAAYGCGATDDNPVRYDRPRPMGFSFVLPASQRGRVLARLQVGDGGPTLALRP